MENLISFSGLSDILRTAIKLSMFPVKDIAEKVGMSKSGLYCFSSKQTNISTEKGDLLLAFFKQYDPKTLNVSTELFLKSSNGIGS